MQDPQTAGPVATRVKPTAVRKAARQATWLAAVNAHADTAPLRRDAFRNLVKVAWAHACWMNWHTGTVRPTVEQLAEQTGLHPRTVQLWRRWLRERGLLEELEPGSTPRYRDRSLRAVLGPRVGNRAALFRLTLPGDVSETCADLPVGETFTPSWNPCVAGVHNAHAHEGRSPLRGVDGTFTPSDQAKDESRTPPWGLRQPARTRAERLALCERLRDESPLFRAIGSARRVRHVLRPWLLAGWSARDVLEAIDRRPDGKGWDYTYRTHELRNPAGLVVYRLRAWLDATGSPLPGRYAVTRSSERRTKISEEDRGGPTILVAAVDCGVPPTATFQAAREALRLRRSG